jgi:hypothetical protein
MTTQLYLSCAMCIKTITIIDSLHRRFLTIDLIGGRLMSCIHVVTPPFKGPFDTK